MYLIDGNNLAGRKADKLTEAAKRDLLTELAQFVRLKKARVHVVFDGMPDRHFPDGSAFQGVKISHAGRNSTADARIRRMIEETRNPRDFVVVTNDRDLQMGVRVRQARVLGCREFRAQLDALVGDSTQAPVEPKPTTKQEEVDQWLRYFGVSPEEADPPDDTLFDSEMKTVKRNPRRPTASRRP